MNSVQVFQITSSPKNNSGNRFQYLRSNFSMIHFNAQAHRLFNRAPFCSSSCSIGQCCILEERSLLKNIVLWLLQNHRIVFFKIHFVQSAFCKLSYGFHAANSANFFVVLWNNIVAKNNSGSHFQYLRSNFSLIHFECKCLWRQSHKLISQTGLVRFGRIHM